MNTTSAFWATDLLRRLALGTACLDKNSRNAASAMEHDLMPSRDEVSSHGCAHDSKADKAEFAHFVALVIRSSVSVGRASLPSGPYLLQNRLRSGSHQPCV